MKYKIQICILLPLLLLSHTHSLAQLTTQALSPTTTQITWLYDHNDYLYKDYLHFVVDHPDVTLSEYTSNVALETMYSATFKEHKKVFKGPATFTLVATHPTHIHATIQVSYYYHYAHKMMQTCSSFDSTTTNPHLAYALDTSAVITERHTKASVTPVITPSTTHAPLEYYIILIQELWLSAYAWLHTLLHLFEPYIPGCMLYGLITAALCWFSLQYNYYTAQHPTSIRNCLAIMLIMLAIMCSIYCYRATCVAHLKNTETHTLL